MLSRSQLLMLSLGAIIGSGWLFSALAAAAAAGPAAIWSWIVGGILVLFIALAYAEVSTMIPRSGAVARYPQLTHGGFTGFILGWAYLLGSGSVPAIEAIATVQYLAPHVPLSWNLLDRPVTTTSIIHFPQGWIVTVALLAIFWAINIYGARFLGRLNNGLMIWKIALPVATFLLLFFLSFHTANFSPKGGFAPYGVKEIFVVIPGAGIIFSYLGFRQALDYGGEARDPQRDIPFATIWSVVIGIAIYTLLQVAFTGGLVWANLGIHGINFAKLGTVSAATTSPFYAILKASGVGTLGAFASLLLIDAVVSPAGTGYIYLGTSGRTIYGMGMGGYLPTSTTSVNPRSRIPWVAMVASLIVAIVFSLPSKSWYGLVGFITLTTVFTYIMGGSGLVILRRTAPNLARPYRLGAAAFWGPVSFLAAVVIVFWSGYAALAELLAALFIALPLYTSFFSVRRGFMSAGPAHAIGAVFLVGWVALQYWGHWILSTASPTVASAHPYFPEWIALCAVAVYGFSGLTWAFSNAEGRHLINRTWWLITFVFAELILSYYSSFGVTPTQPHYLQFPYDTIWALVIGLIVFYWSVASGYETEELKEINASGSGMVTADSGRASTGT